MSFSTKIGMCCACSFVTCSFKFKNMPHTILHAIKYYNGGFLKQFHKSCVGAQPWGAGSVLLQKGLGPYEPAAPSPSLPSPSSVMAAVP